MPRIFLLFVKFVRQSFNFPNFFPAYVLKYSNLSAKNWWKLRYAHASFLFVPKNTVFFLGNLRQKRVNFSRVGENVTEAGYVISPAKNAEKVSGGCGFITSFAPIWKKAKKVKVGLFVVGRGYVYLPLGNLWSVTSAFS